MATAALACVDRVIDVRNVYTGADGRLNFSLLVHFGLDDKTVKPGKDVIVLVPTPVCHRVFPRVLSRARHTVVPHVYSSSLLISS
jgi:hypothetical protein